ncbi:MAG: hypothetical protein MRY79_05575 [Alphaproteobacteria bacterium]|nr:hypothetical protein [Alphaproteobacteria bacterium]
MSVPLWGFTRLFPLTPVIGYLSYIPGFVNYILVGLLLLFSAVGIKQQSLWVLVGVLFLLIFFVLQDILRFQPYIYMYGFMVLVAVYLGAFRSTQKESHALLALRIMVIGIYFWAGVQKINYTFYTELFPWFIAPIIPQGLENSELVSFITLLVPLLEFAIAFCFLHPLTVGLGFILATGMLVVVLLCLGPMGHGWNSIVLPWNIALYALDIVLFHRAKFTTSELFKPRSFIHVLALFLFIFLPSLSYIGKWHAYPSFQLYSGNIQEAFVSGINADAVPDPFFKGVMQEGKIWMQAWTHEEMNIIVYPEEEIFYNAAKSLCGRIPEADRNKLMLTINSRPDWRTGQYKSDNIYPCLTE